MTQYSTTIVAFGVALIASLGITVPVRQLALHLGMVDYPGPRKLHLTPMPLLGGLAIYFGFVLAMMVAVGGQAHAQIVGILAGATMLAIVGTLDDSGLLHHQVKLFLGMPLAALILLFSGIRAQLFSSFVPGWPGMVLDSCLTVVWVVGITAAFSILDHMDGLCVGIAAAAAGFFALAASLGGQVLVRTLAAATFGAALGFLCWNFNPARIFMGDGGAMLLGYLMAVLGLKLRPEQPHTLASWVVPVFILGIPIFDTTLISISRARRGLLPFASPGKDHTAHRLANLGLGTKGAVLVLYLFACLLGGLALAVRHLSNGPVYVLAGCSGVTALVAVFLFEKAPFERQEKGSVETDPGPAVPL
jgi:UDP-GlcNAc:undecaprenyl-phosphate/decaprenyl-phosphate GlcNAc-1-phosphate transferase